jgi:uncharacterized protein YecE (DUF72 family)
MPTRFHIGAKALRSNLGTYAKRFDFLEVKSGAAPREPAPSVSTLRKWRKSVPPHFDFSVVAGQHLSMLKAGAPLEEDLATALAAVDALEARCILIQTPADVTPSNLWRDRMAKLVARFPRDVTQVIWEPRGVWETDDAALAARGWGIILSVDAAREPVPGGPIAYVRLRALGETRSFGPAALEKVVGAIGNRRDAYVVFETDSALAESKRLRTIAAAVGKGPTGGMGRVIRPRALTVKVRDDEQELAMATGTAVVLGSDAEVADVGSAVGGRGNAVDMVVAGVFAAAAMYPSVLLGPVQLLVGGAGAGLRAIDGRCRQPGIGNPRPRGFLPSERIPEAARVAVPALPAALLAAATTYGKLSVNAVLGPSIEIAKARSKPRAGFLQRIAQRGPAALSEALLSDELTALAGRLAGGLLSARDLDELRPEVTTAATHSTANGRQVVTVPWGASAVRGGEGTSALTANTRIVIAVDRNGLVAVACYEVPKEGLTLEIFELVAPFNAAPVLRGQPRTTPGSLRTSAAPIALGLTAGILDLGVGLGASGDSEAALGEWLATYTPTSELERETALPIGITGVQRAGADWVGLRGEA